MKFRVAQHVEGYDKQIKDFNHFFEKLKQKWNQIFMARIIKTNCLQST